MTRFRITLRGTGVELRGYVDGEAEELSEFAKAVSPWVVIASPAPDSYDPFVITEPDDPPTYEKSVEIISSVLESGGFAEIIDVLASLHQAQAFIIRHERALRETAEAELAARELHHFEVEETNANLLAGLRKYEAIVQNVKKALS